MLEILVESINPRTLTAIFAAIAAVATVLTIAMPLFVGDTLDKRMKAVALEREKMRQRELERMGRPGSSASQAGPGRLPRPGALRHLSILSHDHADRPAHRERDLCVLCAQS